MQFWNRIEELINPHCIPITTPWSHFKAIIIAIFQWKIPRDIRIHICFWPALELLQEDRTKNIWANGLIGIFRRRFRDFWLVSLFRFFNKDCYWTQIRQLSVLQGCINYKTDQSIIWVYQRHPIRPSGLESRKSFPKQPIR